ncbi:MAG: enoyl-CoA hydratase-related protein [Pseudomonadota bacterium]|nr:enoyl-CoA hydratase-related protein [Pseudomonadota bacterium]
MSELVTREDRGRVSILTLNNPPANGYSHAMHKALDAHVLDLRMDKGTDVIVLRGAGERFFCAGADIGYLQTLDPDDKYAFCLHANETLLRLENTPKLVIAALNGHCVGGGLEIALACDLRIGRASGSKPNLVGLPEVSLGVLPGTGGTQRLTRVLGRARALQWMVEGRNVSVEEALSIGLVHQVLPEHGWWEAVIAYAATFTRPFRAAGAVGLIKRAVVGGADLPLEAGLALERELQMRLFAAPDAKEGLAAFLEKRPAVFSGGAPGAGASPRNAPRVDPIAHSSSASSSTVRPVAPAPATALTPPERPRGEHGHVLTPPADPDGRRSSGASREEFKGFEDFENFGPDESELGGEAFGTGGRPHGADDPLPGRIDLHRTRIPDAVLNLLGRSIVERYLVLPVKRTETTILVAMADPTDAEALDAIREETGLEVQAIRAPELDIAVMVARYYRA